jgi:hypothetical protein
MWEFLVLLLVIGGVVLLVGPRIMRSRGPGGQAAAGGPGRNSSGTLLITGSSAGHESDGSQFVTITGVINGPTVREHEVYARMQMAVGTAPSVGQLMPVVYATKNPDKWGFASTQPPEAPQSPPTATELT